MAVRISNVQLSGAVRSRLRSLHDLNPALLESFCSAIAVFDLEGIVKPTREDFALGGWQSGLARLRAFHIDMDLRAARLKPASWKSKGWPLNLSHSEHADIELDSFLDVANDNRDVVDRLDTEWFELAHVCFATCG